MRRKPLVPLQCWTWPDPPNFYFRRDSRRTSGRESYALPCPPGNQFAPALFQCPSNEIIGASQTLTGARWRTGSRIASECASIRNLSILHFHSQYFVEQLSL